MNFYSRICYFIFILLYLLAISTPLSAYYLFNNRNHPELVWQQLETAHIRLVYHPPLYQNALEAAKIAESAYYTFQQTYNVTPNHKITLVISNQDQIANGFTNHHFISIWINTNDYLTHTTGQKKWLEHVIPHEMAHYFTMLTITDWIDFYFPLRYALKFPMSFHEGLAMFYGEEEWGFARSDDWLRAAILGRDSSAKSFYSMHSYAAGFAMIRYLITNYGEKKINQLLSYRNQVGLFSFEEAFQKTYDKTFSEFQTEWQNVMYSNYYGTSYQLVTNNPTPTDNTLSLNALTKINLDWHSIENIVIKNDSWTILGKKTNRQYYHDLALLTVSQNVFATSNISSQKTKTIETTKKLSNIALSQNGKYTVFNRQTRGKMGRIENSIFCNDQTQTRYITNGSLVQVTNDGTIYYLDTNQPSYKIIKLAPNNQSSILFTFEKNTQITQLVLSPNEKNMLIALFDSGNLFKIDIFSLNNKQITTSHQLKTRPLSILWPHNKTIYLTSESTFDTRTIVQEWQLDTDTWTQYQTPPFNITPIQYQKTKNALQALVLAKQNRYSLTLGTITLVPNQPPTAKSQQPNYYNSWTNIKPQKELNLASAPTPKIQAASEYIAHQNIKPFALIGLPMIERFTIATLWTDPLMKHLIFGSTSIPYNLNLSNAWHLAQYQNHFFYPDLILSYIYYPYFAGIWEQQLYTQSLNILDLKIKWPVDGIKAPFWTANYGFGLTYQNNHTADNPKHPLFESGSAWIGSIFGQIKHNLPAKHSKTHPLELFKINYLGQAANSQLGMKKDFSQHIIQLNAGYAPLKNDRLTFTNSTYFERQDGNYFSHLQPGIDTQDNLIINQLISKRRYLRGYDQTILGTQLLIIQNEALLRITDNLEQSIGFRMPFIKLSYAGIAGWIDYAKLWQNEHQSIAYPALGWESKIQAHLFGIPALIRIGRAFNWGQNYLGDYFQFELNINL